MIKKLKETKDKTLSVNENSIKHAHQSKSETVLIIRKHFDCLFSRLCRIHLTPIANKRDLL